MFAKTYICAFFTHKIGKGRRKKNFKGPRAAHVFCVRETHKFRIGPAAPARILAIAVNTAESEVPLSEISGMFDSIRWYKRLLIHEK